MLSGLREDKYVDYELINGLYYYNVADKGRFYVEKKFKDAKRLLEDSNPDEAGVIELLFALGQTLQEK